ncbi:MAG: aminotransferase class V-fold PLP-dependent enzyme, partial [Ruminiclostridium sp.]|nr:aminotransferase class V-fold PLP-dependent enzyme [Ruminiclostridium sp.]
MNTIYLDHAATTRVIPEAAQAALQVMTEEYGNPSSLHHLGVQAAKDLAARRETVAKTLGCKAEELFFTSCGTEGDNWAIQLAVHLNRHKGKHIITTSIEHTAVLEPIKKLETQGYEVTYLDPDANGRVTLADLEAALRPDTVLVAMMLVNNETGAIQPVADAARLLKRKKSSAFLHCDAIQGFLKIPFTVKSLGADTIAISGHKIGAPKGIGALYISPKLHPIQP